MKLRDLKKGIRVKYNANAHRTFKCDKRIHIVREVDGECAVLGKKDCGFVKPGEFVHRSWLEKA